MNELSIGFIGFGEAAFYISTGLKQEGLNSIFAYDKFWNIEPQAELICKRSEQAGVTLVPDMQLLVEKAKIVVSSVSADMAVALAQSAVAYLKENQIYVDINATSPRTKEEVDKIISQVALFVDCAVMGPVPNYRHKVPISVSGNGAGAFYEQMKPFRMNITLMDAPAGSASASKMFRSIFMKGFVMLILEMISAAHRYGVEDDVLSSVNETLTSGPFLQVVSGLIGRGVIHSERREHEMHEVIATLDKLGEESTMSRATKAKLRWCTELKLKEYFKGVPPEDFHEILLAIDRIKAANLR